MRGFRVIWAGQLLSVLGSGLTGFALSVWVYRQTGSVSDFTLVQLCGLLPMIIVSALASAMLDRLTWRQLMILADAGCAITVAALALVAGFGSLGVWHVCLGVASFGACRALRTPAYSAAIAQLVAKADLGRANGMVGLAEAIAPVLAPTLGGALLTLAGLHVVFLIDILSYCAALTALVAVAPRAAPPPDIPRQEPFSARLTLAVRYVLARPGLAGLLAFYAATNFIMGMVSVLVAPLVLSMGGPATLGMVMSSGGVGLLAGGLLMSTWGGPRRRIHGVLGFTLVAAASLVIGGVARSVPLLIIAAFGFYMAFPITGGCSGSIWQTKVESAMRVRVFALVAAAATATQPLGFLAAGPLADRVFEPLMASHGLLASSLGSWIGAGPGRGVALFLIVNGCLIATIVALGYASPRIRHVEDELPDALPASDEPKARLADPVREPSSAPCI